MPSTYAWASSMARRPRSPSVVRMRSTWAWRSASVYGACGQNCCSRPWLARGAAGEGGQVPSADVSEEVHLPEAVLGGGVARAEGGAVAGGALDVGDAGLLVAGDGDVGARAGGGLDLVGGDSERRVVEEVVDLGVGESGISGHQGVVARQLVGGVGGHGAECLVQEDLGECRVAVLAGRQDVGALAAAVIGDRERYRVVGGGGRDRGGEGEIRAAPRAISPAATAVLRRAVGRRIRAPPWGARNRSRGGTGGTTTQ